MEKSWTVSIIGMIVALGGLGFIAIFFAVMGYFFKKGDGNLNVKSNAPFRSNTTLKRVNTPPIHQNRTPSQVQKEDEEIVAVIATALATFDKGAKRRVISVNRVEGDKRVNVWKFHNTQLIWRTLKRK